MNVITRINKNRQHQMIDNNIFYQIIQPQDEQKKNNTIENAMKAYEQGNSGHPQSQDQTYSQYQYPYYGQYQNQGVYQQYNNPTAYSGYNNYQQYSQYYPQYYPQQQQQQQSNYYHQYPYGATNPGQAVSYYQGNYAPQNMAIKQQQQQMPYYGAPPQTINKPAPSVNQNYQYQAKTSIPDSSKQNQQPEQLDPLLDEIKRTVLNDQIVNRKSRWSQDIIVPSDIQEQFEKKPEKKMFEFDLLNILNDQQKQQFYSYIRRCFDKCQNSKEQQQMSALLLANLTTQIYKKSLDVIKWESYYMPVLPREKEQSSSSTPQYQFQPSSTSASGGSNSSNFLNIPGTSMPGSTGSYFGGGHTQQQQQQLSSQFHNKDSFQQKSEPKNSQTTTLPFSINTQPSSSINQLYSNNNNHIHQGNQYQQQYQSYNNNNSNQHGKQNKNNNNYDDNNNFKINSGKRHAQVDIKDVVKNPNKKQLKLENKQKQIQAESTPPPFQLQMVNADTDQDFEQLVNKWNIVGTCTEIEKPYLRLTKEPSPDQIRPEEVLKKALKFLMNKWKNRDCEYSYIQSQFRSIRQDLIIQHIHNEFTAKVCEYNARICLEVDDKGQYVQCCATLFDLYNIGIQGEREEFYCYKIIDQGLDNKSALELPKLINEVQLFIDHPLIQFAIDLIRAHDTGNFYKFFQLYEKSPNMCQCIIERNIIKYRLWALTIVSKSFSNKMALEDLFNLLKFDDIDHAKDFITSLGNKNKIIQNQQYNRNDQYYITTNYIGGVLDDSGKDVLLKDSHRGFLESFQNL